MSKDKMIRCDHKNCRGRVAWSWLWEDKYHVWQKGIKTCGVHFHVGLRDIKDKADYRGTGKYKYVE